MGKGMGWDQKNEGMFIMRSGIGITKAKHQTEANELVEYLISEVGQTTMVQTTFQYPTNKKAEIPLEVQNIGIEQGVTWKTLKINFVPLEKLIQVRDQAQKLLKEINFDKL